MNAMTISESVDVLLRSKDRVVEQFYDRLLTRYPELCRFFEHRDLRLQSSMVTMSLVHVEAYYSHRFPATEHYLHVLGHRHYDAGVRREDLEKFRDVMVEALREFLHVHWHPSLETAWRDALNLSIQTMMHGYRQDFPY